MEVVRHPRQTVQDKLQAEFCPPLDSTLVAALVTEVDFTSLSDSAAIDALDSLRDTLSLLAKQAEEDDNALSQSFAKAGLLSDFSATDETGSTLTVSEYTTATSVSSTNDRERAAIMINSPPLRFLCTAFPHLSVELLSRTLNGSKASEMDMEMIVEKLLTEDYARELQERGLAEGVDEGAETGEWFTVNKRSKSLPRFDTKETLSPASKKKKEPRAKAVPLVDVRQKQHLRPPPPIGYKSIAVDDPWAQITSLSAYLSNLLPNSSESFFQSYFHSPAHATPATALRAALATISTKSQKTVNCKSHLFDILEVVCASVDYDARSPVERMQIISDAELSISATFGQIDSAFDLVLLLIELDKDSSYKLFERGVYHSPAPELASSQTPLSPRNKTAAGNGGSYITPGTSSTPSSSSSLPSSPVNAVFDWQIVKRSQNIKGDHPLSAYIPAYNSANTPKKSKSSRTIPKRIEKKDDLRSRLNAARRRRNNALRDASRYWQSGNSSNRGGDVAFFFADRARQIQEEARSLSLEAARDQVTEKRFAGSDNDTIDLHGTTVSEAVTIVKDVLREGWVSQSRPLKIVTGKGSHSINGVGILSPAVRNALQLDGWNVRQWDSGLIVHGKART